jgi:hypothetical protein
MMEESMDEQTEDQVQPQGNGAVPAESLTDTELVDVVIAKLGVLKTSAPITRENLRDVTSSLVGIVNAHERANARVAELETACRQASKALAAGL